MDNSVSVGATVARRSTAKCHRDAPRSSAIKRHHIARSLTRVPHSPVFAKSFRRRQMRDRRVFKKNWSGDRIVTVDSVTSLYPEYVAEPDALLLQRKRHAHVQPSIMQ